MHRTDGRSGSCEFDKFACCLMGRLGGRNSSSGIKRAIPIDERKGMQSTERRVAALEIKASAVDASLKLVFVEAGETEADAMKQAGYPPDAADALHVVFVSPTDARL